MGEIFEIGQIHCKSIFIWISLFSLMINKFETNQIVLYLPVGYMMHLKPPGMCHMSHVLCLVSNATFQPLPNRKSYGPAIFTWYSPYPMCYVSCVTCQVSHVTCDVSCVTCDMSHEMWHNFFIFFYFFLYKLLELVGEGSVIIRSLDFF